MPCRIDWSAYEANLRAGDGRSVPASDVRPLLADLRRAGWLQREIAAETGLSRDTIGNLERGVYDTVNGATADAIAQLHRELDAAGGDDLPAGPVVAAVRQRADGHPAGLVGVLGMGRLRRQFYRAAAAGRVSVATADELTIAATGQPHTALYPTTEVA